jgi:hypothetical protein
MNREIIFTAKEYKEKYNSLMQPYLLEYVDYEDIDFINNEIKRYTDFIKDLDWLVSYKFAEASGMPVDYERLIDERLSKKCDTDFLDWIEDKTEKLLILSFTKIIKFLELQKENVKPTHIKADATKDVYLGQPTNNKDYKDTIWFKTGIPLATGEAFDLYRKYKDDKGYFESICLELGFKKSDRPYFSETINDNPKATDTNKNTFANKGKLQKLHKHLAENQLPFGDEFLKKYNALELE